MLEGFGERLSDWRTRLRQMCCAHFATPRYDETRNEYGGKVYWHAALYCPLCDDILRVEASFYGKKHTLARAIEEEGSR